MTTPASLYLRISVASDESDSLERQERDLRALALSERLDVVAVHIDRGVSGAAVKREAFTEWLRDAESGRARVLLAWRFDRISREGLPAVARLLDVLKHSGARLLTYGDRMDSTSAAFRLTAAVLSEVAYAERESIRARVLSRQAADRRRGYWTKPRPTGYLVEDGRLVPHPTEAALVRQLVDDYLDGASLRALATRLGLEGVPAPRAAKGQRHSGRPWGLTSVRSILASPTLAGFLPHRGAIARDGEGEPIIVADEPLISFGRYRRLQDRLSSRSVLGPAGRRTLVGGAPKHALSGLVRCASCSGPMTFDSREGSFGCQRRRHSAAACPGAAYVMADGLEAEVRARVIVRLAALEPDEPAFEIVALRWLASQAPEEDAERRAARGLVEDAEAAVADLEEARYARGEFPGADGAARWGRLYKAAMIRLDGARATLDPFPVVVDVGGLLEPETMSEALAASDTEDRRELYRLVLDRVVVEPGRGQVGRRTAITWAGQ